MKSNLFKIAFVVAIAVVGGINVFNAQKSETLSDIALANVEALANDEVSRCDVRQCKSASSTCYYYRLDSNGNICETGEKRPYAYDPYNLMGI